MDITAEYKNAQFPQRHVPVSHVYLIGTELVLHRESSTVSVLLPVTV